MSTVETKIRLGRRNITTTITSDPDTVAMWINEVRYQNLHGKDLVIGLDIEWKPTFGREPPQNTAILQLSGGSKTLIVQLIRCNDWELEDMCDVLQSFFDDDYAMFVAVGMTRNINKLQKDYGIVIRSNYNSYELKALAIEKRERLRGLRNSVLKTLAMEFLDWKMERDGKIMVSDWSRRWLTEEQIEYACEDAYVSFLLGMKLLKPRVRYYW